MTFGDADDRRSARAKCAGAEKKVQQRNLIFCTNPVASRKVGGPAVGRITGPDMPGGDGTSGLAGSAVNADADADLWFPVEMKI